MVPAADAAQPGSALLVQGTTVGSTVGSPGKRKSSLASKAQIVKNKRPPYGDDWTSESCGCLAEAQLLGVLERTNGVGMDGGWEG